MEQRIFGSTARRVAVIGQGTWNIEQSPRSAAVGAIRQGMDLGMTHIDTAEMYGAGAAEELVAEAVSGRRAEAFIVSKVMPNNASRAGTIAACEKSLARLKTDRLDCYLLHWPSHHPLEGTIAAFEQLKSDGKILSWGVSNFDVAGLEEARKIAGPGQMACNQVLYHLKERAIEHAVVPWCAQNNVAVVAYSPFGQNDFPGSDTPGGRVLAEVAAAHKASPRQVALAFLTREKHLFAIPKAVAPNHVKDNAGAGDLTLSDADIHRIEVAFPLGPRRRGVPTN